MVWGLFLRVNKRQLWKANLLPVELNLLQRDSHFCWQYCQGLEAPLHCCCQQASPASRLPSTRSFRYQCLLIKRFWYSSWVVEKAKTAGGNSLSHCSQWGKPHQPHGKGFAYQDACWGKNPRKRTGTGHLIKHRCSISKQQKAFSSWSTSK